ncbi:hypothetical protein [Histidinibacterium aquaticum]|uniref:Two pore domain potassium channel family protein n=1 Tax=Histidinibacterium aquaticum TaxID=2613962 RepID=A0A5J5GKV1_9RHOB|nr:hypothetical protein [Histidinibacterium aquaticum]KAA9008283.1 hypothetical protein F3S47_12400 [Histidinibacterium aquaticum]
MQSLPLVAAGLALLVLTSVDFALTTLGATARPRLSGAAARTTFALLDLGSRVLPRGPLARLAGPAVMLSVAGAWIAGFIFGWALLYAGLGRTVTVEGNATPGFWDIWAHVGHLLSTLGGATTQPNGTLWNAMDVLIGVNGMAALTLTMSFLLSTTQAVNASRALARRVLLDGRPEDPLGYEAEIAQIVSQIQAAPFALYYSHPDPATRFPAALEQLAVAAEARDAATARRMAGLVAGLPGLPTDAETGDFSGCVRRWHGRYTLGRDPITSPL